MESKTLENDSELVRKLKAGELKAFDKLYNRYSPQLYRFSKSIMKTHEDAEGIVQEVFIRVWKNRNKLQEHKSFKAFLFSIASNIAMDHFRSRATDSKYVQFVIHQAKKNSSNPLKILEYREFKEVVEKTIDSLPKKRQQIYKMSRVEGMSHREIAEHNQISVKTVENHINLALREIRKQLGRKNLLTTVLFSIYLFFETF